MIQCGFLTLLFIYNLVFSSFKNMERYGSYLKVELYASYHNATPEEKEYHVRFSLNGNILKSSWGKGHEDYLETMEMIPLNHLVASIDREHE